MTNIDQSRPWPLALRLAGVWILFCAWSSSAGWALSSVSLLNRTGYVIALFPLIAGLLWFWKASSSPAAIAQVRWRPSLLRKRWPWLLTAGICLLGGMIYPPSNYDALSYRLPRILYWWQENHWYWFHHGDDRMNYSGTGFEWQMLPLILFTASDRLLFLLNWLPFLLFPGLCFCALQSLKVHPKTASRWMWIIPFGYGFVLQSSSIGNDVTGAVLAAASLAFCHVAVQRKLIAPLLLSALAACCLTSLKLSNLPILLPIAVIWFRALWLVRARISLMVIPAGIAAIPLLILSSFLPLAALNWHHSGSWAGDPDDKFELRVTKPLPGIVGNTFNLAMRTLQLPALPLPQSIRHGLMKPLKGEHSFESWVESGFPRFKATISAEIPREEGAGLGIGIASLLLMHLSQRRRKTSLDVATGLAVVGTGIACLVYMAKMGSESTGRLMLPYYPVMIASFLAVFSRRSPRSGVTRNVETWLPLLCIAPSLLLNPNRPVLPLEQMSNLPLLSPAMLARIQSVVNGYSTRNDPLAGIRSSLPDDCKIVGFAGSPTESAYSIFKPFGQRRVMEAHAGNIETFDWLVASPLGIEERVGQDWDTWLNDSRYRIVEEFEVFFATSETPEPWYVLSAAKD